nr:PREDICTED: DNA topoisomerase 3-alpha [Tribolium castaneum]|eukprot:XP_973578.2 PREDICTED: DNA topoisomerase 3-alpha [Tribolium castaneum]
MGCLLISSLLNVSARFCSTGARPAIMRYLNVAEKNDAAKNIAAILSRGASQRREGFSPYNKIYEFDATVMGQQAHMIMTSVSGHLLNYEFGPSFRNWKSCNPVALFDAPVVKMCPEDYQKIKRTLEREIRSCQGLIIWTDCDREGENIGFEIIKVCSDVKPNLRIYRAKFSEITAASIFRALNTLGQPNKNVSDAVDVRQELDLRTGAAFTRLQTLRLQRVFPQKLADRLISYGSCQFPTLGFVVERYQAIQDFIPEPFWKIKMNHTVNDITTEFTWKRDRLFDKNACEAILDICKESPNATVEKVEGKPKSKWRPLPLDTVEMEKTVSRKLKITAKDTMKIAEKLYTQGLISYPRTETNIFPKELNLANLVTLQQNDQRWGAFAHRIMNEGGPAPRQGKKSDQAHPPIHPTKHADNLTGNEQRVYEYIVRHFLACVHKDAQGFETVVTADIAGEKFTAKGLIILEKNYLEVYTYEKWNAKEIHSYQQGDTFIPSVLELYEGATAPPKLLTEADLIALMEKHGIGTDATHAEHIDTIKTREYVGLHENIYFVPGTLGMGLVEGYNNIGLEVSLAKPILRADFEKDLKLICDGLKDPEVVRREQIQKYRAVFETVVEKMRQIDECLANRLADRPQVVEDEHYENVEVRPVLKCPKCGNDMTIRNKKNNAGKFISCTGYPDCRNAIWLSQNVETIEVLDESCPQCGPNVKLVKMKFKQNVFVGEPNPNTLCIGGCDINVLEALDINLSSVKRTNGVRNNQNHNIHQANANNVPNNNHNNGHTQNHPNPRRDSWPSNTTTFNPTPGPSGPSNRSNTTMNQDDIVCACNLEAVQLTVRKDGPNKGRKFYKCKNQTCDFFLWASDEPSNANTTINSQQQNDVKCKCDLPASRRTVSKEGPNKGRPFYCCPKPMGQGCGFFQWADEDNDGGGDGGPGDDGHGGGPQRRAPKTKTSRGAPPYRAKRKCSKCGQEGHTKNKCPN